MLEEKICSVASKLQLYIGLVLYGVSTALHPHANLGADPRDVFHLGSINSWGSV